VSNFTPAQLEAFAWASGRPCNRATITSSSGGWSASCCPCCGGIGSASWCTGCWERSSWAGILRPGLGKGGTRFAVEHPLGQAMQELYGGERFARAHEMLEEALRPHGIPPVEAGLRWVCYHAARGV
jgi:hypothetical protein